MIAASQKIIRVEEKASVFELNPMLGRASKNRFLRFCRSLEHGLRAGELARSAVLDQFREELPGGYDLLKTGQGKLRFVSRGILDLIYQGWGLGVNRSSVPNSALQTPAVQHATQ